MVLQVFGLSLGRDGWWGFHVCFTESGGRIGALLSVLWSPSDGKWSFDLLWSAMLFDQDGGPEAPEGKA
ncbi:MAG: hypothetical protein M0R06_17675 [Sphaerochaeta sp.]|nr:hypothetical protein [Sphaerochaeta sp.]